VLLAAAPFVFVVHFLEEGPRFVDWFNAHVARGITVQLFWSVNLAALVITGIVVAIALSAPSGGTDLVAFGWFSFLFGANAVLHAVGAIADRRYVPGLVTALLLYVPIYAMLAADMMRARRVSRAALAIVGVVGAIPMLVHGYLIIFKGDRLF